MHETYLQDMNSKYVYPNVFMSIDDTNKVSQYDTDIKKYAEQKKADWILNGGIEKEWDFYLKKMEQCYIDVIIFIQNCKRTIYSFLIIFQLNRNTLMSIRSR